MDAVEVIAVCFSILFVASMVFIVIHGIVDAIRGQKEIYREIEKVRTPTLKDYFDKEDYR